MVFETLQDKQKTIVIKTFKNLHQMAQFNPFLNNSGFSWPWGFENIIGKEKMLVTGIFSFSLNAF